MTSVSLEDGAAKEPTTEGKDHKPVFVQDRYRSLVEDSSFGFFAFDAVTGQILFCNTRGCDLLGYAPEELDHLHIWDLLLMDDRPAFMERLECILAGQTPAPDRFTYTLVRKDLSTFRAELTKSLVRHAGKRVVQGSLKDVTDYEEFQHRLEKAQRLDTIAVMADGLADRLLNAVSVVRQNLEQLEVMSREMPAMVKHLAQIKGANTLIDRLTHRLLSFSRGGAFHPQPMDLNDFVADLLPLFRHTLKRCVRLVFKPGSDLPPIVADPSNLQTALSAVVANAEEAISEKGRIVVSTEVKKVDRLWALMNPDLKQGTYACIAIRDNGAGMSPYTRRRVCEPYFSTKFHGRGLGMAAVYGIIKRHKGWLSIDSEPDKGTCVRLFFPAEAMSGNEDHPDETRNELDRRVYSGNAAGAGVAMAAGGSSVTPACFQGYHGFFQD